jgi:transcriptional regulator with XRE-family HTH domain
MPVGQSLADGLPEAIRGLRKGAKLTQSQLARKLFVRQNTISRYERGTLRPSIHVLLVLLRLPAARSERDLLTQALLKAGVDISDPSITSNQMEELAENGAAGNG